MTMPFDTNSFHALLNALVDQRITAEQFEELQASLKSSFEARQVYLDFLDLHFDLRKLERMEVATDPIADAIHRVGEIRAAPRSSWAMPAIAFFAIAATLLIAISMVYLQAKRYGVFTNSIAQSTIESTAAKRDSQVLLAQSVRASFFGELTPSLNSPMQSNHEYALTTGMIELHFPTGATAILEAPAVFSIANSMRLVLQTGQCSVHAPDGAEGFQVETPLTNIVDLGTRFFVAVDETGETDVQVVEGMAEVIKSNGMTTPQEPPMRLTDRQRRVYSESAGVISQPTEYDDSQYRHQLPDRVVSYQATNPNGHGAVELVDVTVQRGGTSYAYPMDQLIGIELTHFKSGVGKNVAPIAYALGDDPPVIEQIIADHALNTGIINPGGAVDRLTSNPVMASPESLEIPNTPGMAIRFRKPIINDLGPDIVLFDLQTFTNPPGGDAFHIGPVLFEPGLRSHTVRMYDITLNSKEAKVLESFGLMRTLQPVTSLTELRSVKALPSRVHTFFRALAVGIDLSDLGYVAGTTVDQLFIQDAIDDNESFVDPVLIVGLPPVNNAKGQQPIGHVMSKAE